MSATDVSDVIDALLTLIEDEFSDLTGDAAVTALDGPIPQFPYRFVLLPYVESVDAEAVDVRLGNADAKGANDRSAYDVRGLLSLASGNDDQATHSTLRREALALVKQIRARLAVDPSVGDLVDRARVSGYGYTPGYSDAGFVASVPFTITVSDWESQ